MTVRRLLRGHLLLFDRRPPEPYDSNAGGRLLLAAISVEALRVVAAAQLLPATPLWVLLPLFVALALLALRVVGMRGSQIGFRPWHAWTLVEKSYFLQVLVLVNVVFPLLLADPLRDRFAAGSAQTLWTVFVPYLMYGFYQELVYRGMLQLESVRRWGAVAGILAGNVLYTFGPLHWNYYSSPASEALPMLAAIFAIGLFFGVLFRRSGNLWIPAVFHAIGNAYMVAAFGR